MTGMERYEMPTQAEQGPSKKKKLLACKRCRHRKQKCTEVRPCENCTVSGSECIPSESAISKPAFELDYVQLLEERVAQLEALIPQESLDHIDHTQRAGNQTTVSPRREIELVDVPQSPPSHDHAVDIAQSAYPVRNAAASHGQLPSFPDISLEPLHFGLFGAVPSTYTKEAPTIEEERLDSELERFLIQTYFDMAHSQYPIMLKHKFMQWAASWKAEGESGPTSERWKGFFVCIVYAIAFLMTKSRVNGPTRSQTFYTIATAKYLPYVMASPDILIRSQGFLLLTIYALHMPSKETIMTLSSRAIRFCVASQLHLIDEEPDPRNEEAWVEMQHQRRIFWCAYALDRVVCSSYDLPCSIPDSHISVPIFENIDDETLSSLSPLRPQNIRATSATSISSALHIIVGRRIESEIQEMLLRTDFVSDSEEAFEWRARILGKLKEWNARSRISTVPSQKGYVSLRWHKMIYYYDIVALYRPTRVSAQGISGDLSVQACCQALLLFRKFQMAREIAQPWLGLLTQFQIGVTLLYCFFATSPSHWPASYKSTDVPDAIRACSSTLAVLAERWAESECIRDVFEILAKEVPLGKTWERPEMISVQGKAVIEENWTRMGEIVVHRPTLRMIKEIATDKFAGPSEMRSAGDVNSMDSHVRGVSADIFEGMDLTWANNTHASPLDIDAGYLLGSDIHSFSNDANFRQ